MTSNYNWGPIYIPHGTLRDKKKIHENNYMSRCNKLLMMDHQSLKKKIHANNKMSRCSQWLMMDH